MSKGSNQSHSSVGLFIQPGVYRTAVLCHPPCTTAVSTPQPTGQTWPGVWFVNQVSQGTWMATLLCWHTLCGCFWAVMAAWNNCNKDCLACKASSVFYVALYWGPLFWKVSQYLWFHSMGTEPWAVWLPSPVPYATKASTGVREGTFGQSGVEKSFQPGLIPPRCPHRQCCAENEGLGVWDFGFGIRSLSDLLSGPQFPSLCN